MKPFARKAVKLVGSGAYSQRRVGIASPDEKMYQAGGDSARLCKHNVYSFHGSHPFSIKCYPEQL